MTPWPGPILTVDLQRRRSLRRGLVLHDARVRFLVTENDTLLAVEGRSVGWSYYTGAVTRIVRHASDVAIRT